MRPGNLAWRTALAGLAPAQGIWPEVAPYLDGKTLDGAGRLGLPALPGRLARLVGEAELPNLAAGCVRAALSSAVVDDVRARVG